PHHPQHRPTHAPYTTLFRSLIEVGRMTLNKNPEDYFVHIEQAAFEPANLIPGVSVSPDKMLLGRIFSYPDTHRYRIGPNYAQLRSEEHTSELQSRVDLVCRL